MHTKLLTCTVSFLSLLLHPTITSSLDTSFTITNLTHIPTSTVAPHIHNGSITFTFTISSTASSSHYCEQTFITPYDPAAAGGPFACNDAWQDMLYYWREDLSAADGMVEFNVWYAYLDCSDPATSATISESGKLTLPPPDRVDGEDDDSRTRAWDALSVPVQTASSSAFLPGQWDEVCLNCK